MECERLKKLVKNWYTQVQDESMAPARMVDFMNQHLEDCAICMGDQGVDLEVKRITEIVLPPAKIPKAVRKAANKEEKKVAANDGGAEDTSTEANNTAGAEDDTVADEDTSTEASNTASADDDTVADGNNPDPDDDEDEI